VNLDADQIAELAARPLTGLTRRDVALALLAVPAGDARASLPGIRRGMLAAGNPLSASFWSSAEKTLDLIDDGNATVGDVRTWVQATGTEPNGIIGLHVWDEAAERSELAEEMHTRLVTHLEDQVAAGEIDPDALASGDPAALRAYTQIQERWMTSPLPDGRVPMDALLDEQDEEFLAEWDAADAEALSVLDALLAKVGERPVPEQELQQASAKLREILTTAGWPAELLLECGGLDPEDLPADDTELWLTLAAGIASPVGTSEDWDPDDDVEEEEEEEEDFDGEEELSETESAIAGICAIEHFDWLAVTSAVATGGPGTSASAADLAAYVRDFDPDDEDDSLEVIEVELDDQGDITEINLEEIDFGDDELEPFDELSMESLFLPVTTMWQVLGAIDADDKLTALGWWGLPEAMRQVWAPAED
jgi:hypothetical protein